MTAPAPVAPAARGPLRAPVTVGIALGLVMLDNTALTVVIPSIIAERDASEAMGRLLFVAFMLANLATLPAASGLAARIGRRKAYQCGLVAFALGSAVMALDGPLWMLIVARLLQGSGGALMLPNAGGLLDASLTPAQHPRGVATWVTVGSAGIFLGPLLGGVVADSLGWPFVFVIEVALALVGLWLSRSLRDVVPQDRKRIDLGGMALGGAGVSLGCLAVLEAGRPDPIWIFVAVGIVAAPACLVWFVRHERRVSAPALDLAVLVTPGFGALITACLFYNAAMAGIAYVLSLNLQRDQGLSAAATGLVIMLTMGLLPIGSQLAGRVRADRLGSRMVLASASLAVVLLVSAGASLSSSSFALVVLAGVGVSSGQLFTSETVATMALVSKEHVLTALANLSLARQVGSVTGIAILGTAHEQFGHLVEPGPQALASTFLVAAIGVVPAALIIRHRVSPPLSRSGPDPT